MNLAEQFWFLLLGAYRSDLMDPKFVVVQRPLMAAQAKLLIGITNSVPPAVGWTFKLDRGINISSSIFEWRGKVAYIATMLNDRTIVQRSEPCAVWKGYNGYGRRKMFQWCDTKGESKTERHVTMEATDEERAHGLIPGIAFHTSLEIMDHITHPIPYARMQRIGVLSDMLYANRLGVQLKWQDEKVKWWR